VACRDGGLVSRRVGRVWFVRCGALQICNQKRTVAMGDTVVKEDDWSEKYVDHASISRDPEGYLLCFSFFDITELIDIDPAEGTWIYSASEPHNEEQQFELARLRNWLDRFHFRPLGLGDAPSPYHSSGHISGPELAELIREIAPAQVIPVHTTQPQRFADLLRGGPRVQLPGTGAPLPL